MGAEAGHRRIAIHRNLAITVPPARSDDLCRSLTRLKGVIGLTLHRGASLKPEGDVVVIDALNSEMDAILKLIETTEKDGPISVVTSEVASIIDPERRKSVEGDSDEAIWEEMEAGLRHQSKVSINYLLLMALGGAIAAVGLVSPPGPQTLYFVASSIIAPGLEPLAKIPLSLVMRDLSLLTGGMRSVLTGYSSLVFASAVVYWILQAAGIDGYGQLAVNHEVERISHPTAMELIVSACGAIAGMLMFSTYRRAVIAGPVVALVVIPAAALTGMAAAAQRWDLFGEAMQRLALDFALIIMAGLVVFGLKQVFIHRRRALA